MADKTMQLALQGYEFLPELRGEYGTDVFDFRLFGMTVTGMSGPSAAEVFYDSERFERRTALPGRVKKTLLGDGGVHALDDAPHRNRKALFMTLMTPDSISSLVSATASSWALAMDDWPESDRIVLFDTASQVLTRAVCAWAGAPLPAAGLAATAGAMTAMVDGFGGAGPRYRRARQARRRAERWARKVIHDVRDGTLRMPPESAVSVVAGHRDIDGRLLTPEEAAVELLNVIRPTVAVSWYVSFAAQALHHHPVWRTRLEADGDDLVEAFVQEVRRFYPFAPFLGARARQDFTWADHEFPAGRLVFLDVYGMDHDPRLWPDPETFDPERFLDRQTGPYDFIPQGGGDPYTGHRCASERITIELVKQAVRLLVRLEYDVPPQDLSFPLRRIPTRPRSGVVIQRVRAASPTPAGVATR